MQKSFDFRNILTDLEVLDETGRLAFGVCLFERALSGFLQFQSETGSIGGGELRAALAQCWSTLETGVVPVNLFVSVAACEKVMPDSEDHSSAYTSAAIDAVNIACNLLTYIEQRDLVLVIESVQSRRDTLYLFIQNAMDLDPPDEGFEERMANHPLLKEELRLLHDDIAFLQAMQTQGLAAFVPTLDRVMRLDYRKLRLKL
ncbi:DUF416 family protein [Pinirhizobacter sp.]|jgi:hypothetical protein|uniref:DUF416 family protein n=1 Tax=Pinirhizobacter sp. TaxID=2950432 RepID=UPI002F42E2D3